VSRVLKTPLAGAALEYLEQGFSIVPIRAGEKRAAGRWQRWQSERMTEQQAEREFSSAHVGSIALVCGSISGLTVLDFDGDTGAAAMAALEPLIPSNTPRVGTGGGGIHLYFSHGGERVTVWNWQGSRAGEVRGEGGYVLAPPSIHPSGIPYQWLEPLSTLAPLSDSLRSAILPQNTQVSQPSNDVRGGSKAFVARGFSDKNSSNWLERALKRAQHGNRNITGLWLASQLRDDGVTQAETGSVMLEYARIVGSNGAHPYSEREALASLEQAYKRAPREAARRIESSLQVSRPTFAQRMRSRFGGQS
jgi:Bifunctional DNA primase/polymerase, N-terminal